MPGAISYDATDQYQPTSLRLVKYNTEIFEEIVDFDLKELEFPVQPGQVTMLEVRGLGTESTIQAIADKFKIHPLAMEDVLNQDHRSKAEEFEDHLFLVMKIPELTDRLKLHQATLFLFENFVVVFHDKNTLIIDELVNLIRQAKGRLRQKGADYLAYRILDYATDHYFPMLEQFSTRLEHLESRILTYPEESLIVKLQLVRHDLMLIRRSLWPLQECVNLLLKEGSTRFFREETRPFLRDIHDHSIQALEMIETYREITNGIRDIYMSMVSNRMSEIMKVLTIISTIFIPLSFIAGIYGMNFDPEHPWNMPELNWPYGYPMILFVMFSVGFGLLSYFFFKGWIGGPRGGAQ